HDAGKAAAADPDGALRGWGWVVGFCKMQGRMARPVPPPLTPPHKGEGSGVGVRLYRHSGGSLFPGCMIHEFPRFAEGIMGVKRYELREEQWLRIEPLLPGKVTDPGRTASDNRLFVNGVVWVLRSGARWSALPERYGKYKSVHKRFTRWARAGVWKRIFTLLA